MSSQFIGIINGPTGVKGHFTVSNTAGTVRQLKKGTKVRIGFSEAFSNVYTIAECKLFKKSLELKVEGIDSPEKAVIFKEKGLYIDEELYDISENELLVGELIGDKGVEGYMVIDKETGNVIGTIIDAWILPANDVWVVKTDGGNLPLPVIDEVVKKINKKKRLIEIVIIPGLMDLLEKEETHNE